jgi:hypothetical protein
LKQHHDLIGASARQEGAMKRMLILAVTLWIGASATAHAQASPVPCLFGGSLSANLTAFGCASDPLDAPTYQVPAEAGANAVTIVPTGGTPNVTSGAGAGGVSSSASCVGAIPSTAGNAGAGGLIGGC